MAPAGWQPNDPQNSSSSSSSKVEESSSSSRNGIDAVGTVGMDQLEIGAQSSSINTRRVDEDGVQMTCLSEVVDDLTLHFQIIRLPKQIYAWIGCNSAKFGSLYAAAPTRPNNTVGVTSLLGGTSDNIGSGIARRLVLKTGLNVILACNIPKDSPMIEAGAEKKLVQILIDLGYTRPKTNDHLNGRG